MATMTGWFSKKAAAKFGYAVYRTPTGKTVKITDVTNGDRSGYLWPDKKCVGTVTTFVRRVEGSDDLKMGSVAFDHIKSRHDFTFDGHRRSFRP